MMPPSPRTDDQDHGFSTWHDNPTPRSERLPIKVKAGYGAGGMSDFLFLSVPLNMAMPIYAKQFGMDAGLLGVAKAIPRVMAILTDSLMGAVSDNTRSKWGRRKPFILVGALLCALLLPFLWSPPTGAGSWGMFLYVSVFMSIYTMIYSVFFVPYQALGFELTADYDERTRVQAWKGYISGIGFFMAPWFFWFCTLDIFPNIVSGVRWLSIVTGGVIVLGAILTVILCKENAATSQQPKIRLLPALALTCRNRPFMLLQGAAVFLGIAINCGSTVGFYLTLDYVCGGDERFFGLLGGVGGTVANFMTYGGMALGVWVSQHMGKRTTGTIGLALVLLGSITVGVFLAPRYSWLPWIDERYHPWLTIIPGVIINLGLQICNLMFSSMTADVCDEDEMSTGLRREGAYVAVSGAFSKLMGTITLVAGGFMPFLAGYVNMASKPTIPQLEAMKWILVGTQCVSAVAAIAFIYFYPITRRRAEETRVALDQRRSTAGANPA